MRFNAIDRFQMGLWVVDAPGLCSARSGSLKGIFRPEYWVYYYSYENMVNLR